MTTQVTGFVHYQGPDVAPIVDMDGVELHGSGLSGVTVPDSYGHDNRLRSLMDLGDFHSVQQAQVQSALSVGSGSSADGSHESASNTVPDPAPKPKRGPRAAYTKVSEKQLESLIGAFMNMNLTIDQAAKHANLSKSTAYRFLQKYQGDPDAELSELLMRAPTTTRRPDKKLTQEHTEFILTLVESQPLITVEGIHEALIKRFPELSVS
ncbi:hypothetical protein DFQ26_002415, partial [Actinomortierella ambigua]